MQTGQLGESKGSESDDSDHEDADRGRELALRLPKVCALDRLPWLVFLGTQASLFEGEFNVWHYGRHIVDVHSAQISQIYTVTNRQLKQ